MIYLDYAATSPVRAEVMEAMLTSMRSGAGNPSAVHSAGALARGQVHTARRQAASLLGCDAAEVFFTSGGTESNNQAFLMARGARAAVSAIEHDSVLQAAKRECSRVDVIPCDANGVITPEAVERAITPETKLISVLWANNETGVIQPIEDISRVARAHRIPLHVDAVQAAGHIGINAKCCDLMSVSAHKLYGPTGVGCLYVRTEMQSRLPALLVGGGQQEGLRAGTENVHGICGFGVACELAKAELAQRAARESALMDAFARRVLAAGIERLGEGALRMPGIAAFHVPQLEAEAIIAKMDVRGICISGGAACAAAEREPSHVYRAMGFTREQARHIIRVSIGDGIEKADMDGAAQVLLSLVQEASR